MCYKDMTFCPFSRGCKGASTCGRAITPEVLERAYKWWGSKEAPICTFIDKPKCYNEEESVHGDNS